MDTAIANITAVSLNFQLIKLVKEQSLIICNSKVTACVILKEHYSVNVHPPFVVSVAVLIINIHRSRAMK